MDTAIHPYPTALPDFKQATKIYRKKASGMVAHAGLLLEFVDGDIAVFHNNPEHGPHLSSLQAFSEGKKFSKKRVYGHSLPTIKERIIHVLDQRRHYSIFANCEHCVSEVTQGISKSPQLTATAAGITLGALGGYMLSGNKRTGMWIGGLVTGLLALQYSKNEMLR